MWPFGNSAQLEALEMKSKADDQLIAKLESQLAARNLELFRVRSEKVTVGKLADELLKERDEARSQLKVFTDRRDRAKLNLKQFRGSGAVAGPSVCAILNA